MSITVDFSWENGTNNYISILFLIIRLLILIPEHLVVYAPNCNLRHGFSNFSKPKDRIQPYLWTRGPQSYKLEHFIETSWQLIKNGAYFGDYCKRIHILGPTQ